MLFLSQVCAAFVLIALTLVLQSAGMAGIIDFAKAHFLRAARGRLSGALLLMRMAGMMVCLHFLEMLLWACFYRWQCFASWETAVYFSGVTYSTVGYGDVLLHPPWRILASIEAITAVLMCALSASLLFTVMTRLFDTQNGVDRKGR